MSLAPRPPLDFVSNGTTSAAALPGMVSNLAGLAYPSTSEIATDEHQRRMHTLGLLTLLMLLWFFFGPGIRVPCTRRWELHCCSAGNAIVDHGGLDTGVACEDRRPPAKFSPGGGGSSWMEHGLAYALSLFAVLGVCTLFWLSFALGLGGQPGLVSETNYARVVVFALSLGTALWSFKAQTESGEGLKLLGCQPVDGWACKLGAQECQVRQAAARVFKCQCPPSAYQVLGHGVVTVWRRAGRQDSSRIEDRG